MTPDDYLGPEAASRLVIDAMLTASGWVVQDFKKIALGVARGVAVREYPMAAGHGTADYLLFVDGGAVGVVEAKKAGTTLIGVEWQSNKYGTGIPDKLEVRCSPLPFLYESTGVETRFTCRLDPEPASRPMFSFHRPETLAGGLDEWSHDPQSATLRQRLVHQLDPLPAETPWLWDAQQRAIRNLESSMQLFKPRALIQMATGSGKTYTAANVAYRLIKDAGAKRILFLVDRSNLGTQTLKEFQHFTTPDDGRKFSELYNLQQLTSNTIDPVAKVTISTIQRLYSIMRGEEDLDPEVDEHGSFEIEPSRPVEVSYASALPVEFYDVIIIDECHRSIFGVWRQVLEYFDAFQIGLTATPGAQAFGYFNQNLVMEYPREQAVADGVNVDFDVYRIRTEIAEHGSTVEAGYFGKFRDRETRAVRMEKLDKDFDYEATSVGTSVIAVDQIRTIIQTFKEKLPEIFPKRNEVPKTLVFARSDAHADDIVQVVREEFGKGNDFAVKITSKAGHTAQLLSDFRNTYNPRVAVTVDMIATGTDVPAVECLLFMRIVKSRNYFEQMKGRGSRIIGRDDLQARTPSADVKDRFVIVDAVGATETDLNENQPLERRITVSLEKLLMRVATGAFDDDDVSSIASRLARLNTQLTTSELQRVEEIAGSPLHDMIHGLVDAIDPDVRLEAAQAATGLDDPGPEAVALATKQLLSAAVKPIADNPNLREELVAIRQAHDQFIDEISVDVVLSAEYSIEATESARHTVESWQQFIRDHRDDITALQILYNQPYGSKDLNFREIKELAQAIERPPHNWTPDRLWDAYGAVQADKVRGTGQRLLTDLVSLVRHALDPDGELVPFPEIVAERYSTWLEEQAAVGRVFTDDQRAWLDRIRDHIAASLQITPEDFEYAPFNQHGGLGAAYAALGDDLDGVLTELNEVLVS
jgi:type I restriction enzyme R subunit